MRNTIGSKVTYFFRRRPPLRPPAIESSSYLKVQTAKMNLEWQIVIRNVDWLTITCKGSLLVD